MDDRAEAPIPSTLIPAIRRQAGLAPPGLSQFEDLSLLEQRAGPDHSLWVRFRYGFDQDGHSQYDKTLGFAGEAVREASGRWRITRLRVEHVGEAASYQPPAQPVD